MARLAGQGEDPACARARRAVDLGFSETGEMKESMPFHDEMSDSLFMATAIPARAGALTGGAATSTWPPAVAFMQKLVFRPDGLYRHSPLTDAAWGRGRFPALGLALTLESFPKDHAGFARSSSRFNGTWRRSPDSRMRTACRSSIIQARTPSSRRRR